jgi:uncharacterized protein (DUF433 family)
MKASVVSVDREIMGGTPVFRGTRVPIQTLLDYVEGGETIDEFLEDFPTVCRDMVIAYLESSKKLMLAEAI